MYGKLQENGRATTTGKKTLCVTRAIFFSEIDTKSAAAQLEHPDQAPAFTLTVRTPQCCLGNYGKSQCLIGKSTISMAIFTSSSVKLPHGIISMMV